MCNVFYKYKKYVDTSLNIIHLTQLYIHTNNILLGYIRMNAHTNKMKAFPQLMV